MLLPTRKKELQQKFVHFCILFLQCLPEAEDIKMKWQEYREELYKKDLHNPDNHNGGITHHLSGPKKHHYEQS